MKAKFKGVENVEGIGQIIVAAWFKALRTGQQIDANELSAAFSNLLDVRCVAVVDEPGVIHIPVPLPPETTVTKLVKYLHDGYKASISGSDKKNPFNPKNIKKHKGIMRTFAEDLGDASLFGCGR